MKGTNTATASYSFLAKAKQGKQLREEIRVEPLLYCVIFLLTIIIILLLVKLLTKWCKKFWQKSSENMPALNVDGGTFHMKDLECNSDLENDGTVSHSNNVQTYTVCSDDTSSTSSESSCNSSEGKPNENNQDYTSLRTTLQTASYKNILEGKSTSALDYANKKAKKDRDYVNIEKQRNMPLTNDRKSTTERQHGDQDESQTSSESCSDESDDDSINYSTVVFKPANAVQRDE